MFLLQRQCLPAIGIMEETPNLQFRILLTHISSQDVHVPKDMIMWRLCNDSTAFVDPNQLPLTSTKDKTVTVPVSIVPSSSEITSVPNGTRIQVSNEWRSSTNIPYHYGTYRDEIICIVEPLKWKCNVYLGYITTETQKLKLDPRETSRMHFIPYQGRLKAKDFEEH